MLKYFKKRRFTQGSIVPCLKVYYTKQDVSLSSDPQMSIDLSSIARNVALK